MIAVMRPLSFSRQHALHDNALSASERRVIDYLVNNREAAMIASAAELGRTIGTSDATIIRAARRLGFDGLEALRKALADDLKRDLSLSERLENSVRQVRTRADGALQQTILGLRTALDGLAALPAEDFDAVLDLLCRAPRIRLFGIGPSGYVAGYFAAQLTRMGAEATALQQTGLLFADDLQKLRAGDGVIALAYDRPYPEVSALFDRVTELGLASVLVTSPGPVLPDHRAGLTLRVMTRAPRRDFAAQRHAGVDRGASGRLCRRAARACSGQPSGAQCGAKETRDRRAQHALNRADSDGA